MADGYVPKITWGASFANTLDIGYPLDNAVAYGEPVEGSEWIVAGDGTEEDAWIPAELQYLEGDIRWIPTTNETSPVTATGWDTATTGFAAFLTWARAKNAFRFFPNKDAGTYITSFLVEPMRGAPEPEDDGTRRVRIKIRNASTAYTGY